VSRSWVSIFIDRKSGKTHMEVGDDGIDEGETSKEFLLEEGILEFGDSLVVDVMGRRSPYGEVGATKIQ
jgi:hypothetical protein